MDALSEMLSHHPTISGECAQDTLFCVTSIARCDIWGLFMCLVLWLLALVASIYYSHFDTLFPTNIFRLKRFGTFLILDDLSTSIGLHWLLSNLDLLSASTLALDL